MSEEVLNDITVGKLAEDIQKLLNQPNRPKIGLALGGGGAKAFAHIGVLKVLNAYKIPIDYIAGTSMGAVVGAMSALGKDYIAMLDGAKRFAEKGFLKLKNVQFFHYGLIKGRVVSDALKDMVGDKTFADTQIPFSCVAVDLESGQEVILDQGPLAQAIQASSALPLVFPPVFTPQGLLVDGGILNMVPVDLCRSMGAEIVIAIQIRALTNQQFISAMIYKKFYEKPKLLDQFTVGFFRELKLSTAFFINILVRTLDIANTTHKRMRAESYQNEVVIEPKVGNIAFIQFEHYRQAFNAGEKSMLEAMPRLYEKIREKMAGGKREETSK